MDTRFIDAVAEQFGDKQDFVEAAQDITAHGAMGGFPGFCYYSETVEFAKKNWPLIREELKEQTRE